MTGNKKMVTLRIQVTIPYGSKRPQRVRVVAKDRGALLFAYRRELGCVPLYKAGWRRVPGDKGTWLWQNEQAMAVSVDMARLLSYKKLALQLYCLRGDDVKHKGVFNLRRVMEQQQREDELHLAMQYSTGCWWWRCLACTCFRRSKDEAVLQRGGGENLRLDNNAILSQTRPQASVALFDREQVSNDPAAAQHAASGSSHASGGPDTSQEVVCGLSGAGDDPTAAEHAASGSSHATNGPDTSQDVICGLFGADDDPSAGQQAASVTATVEQRPARFPDSGAVFPELLREHDSRLAKEKADREETQKKEAPLPHSDVGRVGKKVRGVLCYVWRANRAVYTVWRAGSSVSALWKAACAVQAVWTGDSVLRALWIAGGTVYAVFTAGGAVRGLLMVGGAVGGPWRLGGMHALLTGRRVVRALWTARRSVRTLWRSRGALLGSWTAAGAVRAVWTAGRGLHGVWMAGGTLNIILSAGEEARVLGVAGGMGAIALLANTLLESKDTQPVDWLLCGVGAAILLVDFCVQGCKWLRRRRGATSREHQQRPTEGDSPAD
ncbi:hypothetical protein E2C01_045359 [Portunus trituberculatus]|uniref:Uncharacterized protein n=1 Tax=Portunus trituberculatus TaxID=210409 RepID=A0A5B7FVJ7_PORTR|nr:hypothetical protein [Portunus trituberculatus]